MGLLKRGPALCSRPGVALACWVVGCILQSSGPARAQEEPAREDRSARLEAAFLYNFAKFVSWPGEDESDEFRLCVLGDETLERVLVETVAGKTVRGHRMVVSRDPGDGELVGCAMLFVGSGVEDPAALVASLGEMPVLTVANWLGFIDQGGVISLIERDNKLRFRVSPRAAKRRGLVLSSKLLSLAEIYEPS